MTEASGRRRRRARRALLALVGVFYALSIPWYRTAGEEPILWLGLPGWVAVALLCYVGAALANAAAWLLTDVSDEVEGEGSTGPPGPPGASSP